MSGYLSDERMEGIRRKAERPSDVKSKCKKFCQKVPRQCRQMRDRQAGKTDGAAAAKRDKELTTIGNGDKIEVWSRDIWESDEGAGMLENIDIAEGMEQYGI